MSADGTVYKFDLYVDCSGFRSLLLGKELKPEWLDYSSSLKTNRAITGVQSHGGQIKPYTLATTFNHGWQWTIPTRGEDHVGYVFAKEYCSDDEAFAELKKTCTHVENEKVISFKTGRYKNSWQGNVIGIGNSFAFIEPLESTGIHMILLQLLNLKNCFENGHVSEDNIKKYNEKINAFWDHLKWFIAIHFKYNRKLSTPFWKECQDNIDVSGISEYLDYFEKHGPLWYNREHPLFKPMSKDAIFSTYSFDLHLAGCGVNPGHFEKRNQYINDDWLKKHAFNKQLISQAISHEEGLAYLENNGTDFIPGWFN